MVIGVRGEQSPPLHCAPASAAAAAIAQLPAAMLASLQLAAAGSSPPRSCLLLAGRAQPLPVVTTHGAANPHPGMVCSCWHACNRSNAQLQDDPAGAWLRLLFSTRCCAALRPCFCCAAGPLLPRCQHCWAARRGCSLARPACRHARPSLLALIAAAVLCHAKYCSLV